VYDENSGTRLGEAALDMPILSICGLEVPRNPYSLDVSVPVWLLLLFVECGWIERFTCLVLVHSGHRKRRIPVY